VILPALFSRSNYELRTNCEVLRINLDSTKKKATGVTYVDAAGAEYEQPADLVLIAAFPLNNVRTLLLSGIGDPYDPKTGKGVVGRNYCYQTTGGPIVFMDDSININPFMSSGAPGTMIDDFSGDNFDHANLGFIGGQYVGSIMTGGRPIEFHPTPPDTPKWGLDWKRAVARHYNHTIPIQQHGTSQSSRLNYLDLDPVYKDAWGRQLLRPPEPVSEFIEASPDPAQADKRFGDVHRRPNSLVAGVRPHVTVSGALLQGYDCNAIRDETLSFEDEVTAVDNCKPCQR
jgi:gluconate 2-dehydrogenase alpha chain